MSEGVKMFLGLVLFTNAVFAAIFSFPLFDKEFGPYVKRVALRRLLVAEAVAAIVALLIYNFDHPADPSLVPVAYLVFIILVSVPGAVLLSYIVWTWREKTEVPISIAEPAPTPEPPPGPTTDEKIAELLKRNKRDS